MTAREYLDLFRERWKAVIGGLLLGILVAVAVVQLSPPQYASQATLFVSAGTSTDASAALDRNELSIQRMETYVQLATNESVAQDVVDRLELNMSSDELAGKIDASAEPNTVLLTVTVTDADRNRAAQIANVLADQLVERIDELERPAGALAPPVDPAAPADPIVSARIVEEAVPATSPVFPRPLLTVAIGALLGLLAGVALAAVRRALVPTIRNSSQLADVAQAPVLGVIARHRHARTRPLVVRDEARGAWAEAVRRLRANLLSVDLDRAHRVVMFTSPSPRDGTTTVLCNLACAVGETGRRVLVVEADLRRPRAADCFGAERTVGLTHLLAGRARLDDVVAHAQGGVDIVTSGVTSGPNPPNPSAQLAWPQMARFLTEARQRYEAVLVDAPPVLPVADATVLAPLTDAVVLVVRHGTPAQRVEAARDALQAVSARLLGTVLTMKRDRVSREDARYAATVPATRPATGPATGPDAAAVPDTAPDVAPPKPAPTSPTPGNVVPAPRWRPSPFPRIPASEERSTN